MANTLATLVVQLSADVAQFQSDLGKAAQLADSRMGQIAGAAKKAAGLIGVSLGGIQLGEIFKDAIKQAMEAEQASSRLSAVLKSTGMAAGITKEQLDGMADAMAKSTQFDDESIRNAASQILTFRNVQGATFRETLSLSADVASFFGEDLPSAAAKLAKSLEDPESAFGLLRRAGVVLTQQQKDQISAMGELGDKSGQQAVILERLKGAFGGTAEIMNTGLTKATRDASKAWNEFLEALGRTGPVKNAVEGSLLSIAGALDAIREAQDKSSKQLKERALTPGIFVDQTGGPSVPPRLGATQIGGAPALGASGQFNDQLGKLSSPEIISPEEAKKRMEAQTAALKQAQEAQADLLLQLKQKTAQARLGALNAEAQSELEATKGNAQRLQEEINLHHEQSLMSIGTFYEASTAIQKAKISAEIATIDKLVAGQRSEMDSLKEPAQKITAQAAIDTQLAKRAELIKDLGQVIPINAMKQRKAEEDLRDAVTAVNIELMKQRGNLIAAADAEAGLQSKELRKKAAENFGEGSAPVMAIDLARGNKVREAQQQIADTVADVNAQLLRESNLLGEAAAIDFDIQNRQRRDQINLIFGINSAEAKQLEQLKTLTVAQADFNQARAEQANITARLQIEEERIQNSLRTGAISELAALGQTSEARKRAADDSERAVRAQADAAARAPSNDAMQVQAEQSRAALAKLRAESELLAERFNTVLSDSFAGAFSDFITGTKTASEAFKSFATSVVNEISKIYAKQLATQIVGGGTGGAGGLLSGLFSGLFGGGGTGGSIGYGTIDPTQSGIVGSFAVGTDYVPRTGLAMIHQGEAIIPASENRGDWGGGVNIVNHNDFRGVDPMAIARVEAKLDAHTRATYALVRDSQRRRVSG